MTCMVVLRRWLMMFVNIVKRILGVVVCGIGL
jgi:hypothetical protein